MCFFFLKLLEITLFFRSLKISLEMIWNTELLLLLLNQFVYEALCID